MNSFDVPAAWSTILAAVQTVCPSAVLAGGALRDHFHSRPVKDLDIFVPAHCWEDMGNALSKLDRSLAAPAKVDFTSCAELSDCLLSETYTVSGVEVNVITLKDASKDAVLNRIDFGICQIAWDGAAVMTTEAYTRDDLAKTFTITRADNGDDLARTLRRWERLSLKYPDWTLVNPFARPEGPPNETHAPRF